MRRMETITTETKLYDLLHLIFALFISMRFARPLAAPDVLASHGYAWG
jgi:hypothetical protein